MSAPDDVLRTMDERIAWIMAHPGMSPWLKTALQDAGDRDPIELLNALEILTPLLRARCHALIQLTLPDERQATDGSGASVGRLAVRDASDVLPTIGRGSIKPFPALVQRVTPWNDGKHGADHGLASTARRIIEPERALAIEADASGCHGEHGPAIVGDVTAADDRSLISRAKRLAKTVKRDVVALWIAARDPRVPWRAKLLCAVIAAYALSPIDLIPDFVPVLGYLDDLILLPLAILLAVRMVPPPLMDEFRAEADRRSEHPTSKLGAAVIVALWMGAACLLLWILWP